MLKSRCFQLPRRETPIPKSQYMDMYFEAETYYCKKLNKVNKTIDEKEAIIERQSALIMHLIKNEQNLVDQIKTIEQSKDVEEPENKSGNKISLPQLCVIM